MLSCTKNYMVRQLVLVFSGLLGRDANGETGCNISLGIYIHAMITLPAQTGTTWLQLQLQQSFLHDVR